MLFVAFFLFTTDTSLRSTKKKDRGIQDVQWKEEISPNNFMNAQIYSLNHQNCDCPTYSLNDQDCDCPNLKSQLLSIL